MANKRKDGRWETVVYLKDGKRKHLYAPTLPLLKKKEAQYRDEIERGFDVHHRTDSLNVWAERLYKSQENKLTPSNFKTHKSRLKYFLEELGSEPLVEIKKSHIEPLMNSLAIENPYTHKPTAKKTMIEYLSALSDVFEFAIADHVTEYNPCKYIEIDRDAPKNDRRSLSQEEQKRVLYTSYGGFKTAIMIAMLAGLRRGEVAALQWADVDLKGRSILVNKSYNFKEHILKKPKTESGIRSVPMTDLLYQYLITIPRECVYVVHNNGHMLDTEYAWKKGMKEYLAHLNSLYATTEINPFNGETRVVEVDKFGLHDLRHTFCTNLYYSNCPVNTCRLIMGHKDVATTMNIYTHLDKISQRNSCNELNDFLQKRLS